MTKEHGRGKIRDDLRRIREVRGQVVVEIERASIRDQRAHLIGGSTRHGDERIEGLQADLLLCDAVDAHRGKIALGGGDVVRRERTVPYAGADDYQLVLSGGNIRIADGGQHSASTQRDRTSVA